MIDIIQFPSIPCAYNGLLARGWGKHDDSKGEGLGGVDGDGIPLPEMESASKKTSEMKIGDGGGLEGHGKIWQNSPVSFRS
jgi:hypothetical protein